MFMLGLTPALAIFGFLFGKITAAFTSREQKQYASAGAVAEEILSSIRTVYAFGGEKLAAARYKLGNLNLMIIERINIISGKGRMFVREGMRLGKGERWGGVRENI